MGVNVTVQSFKPQRNIVLARQSRDLLATLFLQPGLININVECYTEKTGSLDKLPLGRL